MGIVFSRSTILGVVLGASSLHRKSWQAGFPPAQSPNPQLHPPHGLAQQPLLMVPPHRLTASQARPRREGPTAVDPPLHRGTQSSRLLASRPPFLLSMALNSESHKCCPTELYFQPLPYIYLLTIT